MRRLIITLALLALTAFGLSRAFAASQYNAYLPLVACPSGCSGPTSGPGNPTPIPSTPTPDPSASISYMVKLVNQARAAAGCPAVTANTSLMKGAQDWSTYMGQTGDYRHSDGGYYEARGYPVGTIVENVASGTESADYAFEGWMLSSAHKANIEFCLRPGNPSYTPTLVYDIGVGYSNGYWTLAIGVRQP